MSDHDPETSTDALLASVRRLVERPADDGSQVQGDGRAESATIVPAFPNLNSIYSRRSEPRLVLSESCGEKPGEESVLPPDVEPFAVKVESPDDAGGFDGHDDDGEHRLVLTSDFKIEDPASTEPDMAANPIESVDPASENPADLLVLAPEKAVERPTGPVRESEVRVGMSADSDVLSNELIEAAAETLEKRIRELEAVIGDKGDDWVPEIIDGALQNTSLVSQPPYDVRFTPVAAPKEVLRLSDTGPGVDADRLREFILTVLREEMDDVMGDVIRRHIKAAFAEIERN